MKKCICTFVLTIICIVNSFAQRDTNIVTVYRFDSSPFNFRITNLWTGKNNPINVDQNVIGISTDNGSIDTISSSFTNYFITPKTNGIVNIYTLSLKKGNGSNSFDTLKTTTTFTAITPPEIVTLIDKKLLKNSLKISYSFVYANALKAIDEKRYQMGAFPSTIKVYKDNIEVGNIESFTDGDEIENILKQGNKIHFPTFIIRDMTTDLIIETPEIDYIYK